METRTLEVASRLFTGKEEAGRLKRTGVVPAVFYGAGRKSVSITVDPKMLLEAIDTEAGENTLLTFKTKDLKELDKKVVIIKDWQHDPLTKKIIHVDFYEVVMDKEMEVKVPVVFIGKAKGLEQGGIVQVVTREIVVRCLPTAIPEKVEIDVGNLEIGDSIHIQDIKAPMGSAFVFDTNYTVVTVAAPVKEEVVAPPVEAAAEAGAVPVEGEAQAPGAPGAAPKAEAGKEGKPEAKAKEGDKKEAKPQAKAPSKDKA